MLPSLVVNEVRRGVAETPRTQFEPSNGLFRDAIRRLIADPGWIKDPSYAQLGMPFVAGAKGKHFVPDFETEHPIADDGTVLEAIQPRTFARPQEVEARFLPAFFTDPDTLAELRAGIDTPLGRVRLGQELKNYLL